MRFHVVSCYEACRWNSIGTPHLIISITTPDDPDAPVCTNEYTLGILRLAFHDLDAEPGPAYRSVYGEPVLFNTEMAQRIATFVAEAVAAPETIIVHCDAGQSRSPAVAAALAYRYAEPEAHCWLFRYRTPNRLVYRTLLSVLMDEGCSQPPA